MYINNVKRLQRTRVSHAQAIDKLEDKKNQLALELAEKQRLNERNVKKKNRNT